MGRLTVVLGGASSGKSAFAEETAQELGGDAVLYVATAEAGDDEMRQRIEKHRARRPADWRTLEVRTNVGAAILEHPNNIDVVLLDSLTLVVSNHLTEAGDPFGEDIEAEITAEVEAILACAERLTAHLIVVSDEVGLGLVPASPLGRAYRDLLGRANQMLAQQADEVYLLIAGIPQQIKM